MSTMRYTLKLLCFLIGLICANGAESECLHENCDSIPLAADAAPPLTLGTCSLVYAPVPGSGEKEWSVFSLTQRGKSSPVWPYGDVVIQVPDANEALQRQFRPWLWNAQETGGHYEGFDTTYSLVPGLGMMTRSSSTPNLLPFVPRFDEGGLTRFESPGAGANTYYHNYTWYIRRDLQGGQELTIQSSLREFDQLTDRTFERPTLEYLLATGYCMDNMRPRSSKLKQAGRGAFATKFLSSGTIVAPVPVVPVSSNALQLNPPEATPPTQTEQLLRNYCLGHVNATTLLYPYGPMINLINHFPRSNVKLQWSRYSQDLLTQSLSTDASHFLLMELVATRDIQPGEELYLDYGKAWEEAWFQHSQGWEAADHQYSPSYVMDDAVKMLRTQQEQKGHPYPNNVFTSCFYRYSDRDASEQSLPASTKSDTITSFRWKSTRGIYDLKNLRPCEVLRRNEDAKGRSGYAARMFNRPGLAPEEMIPEGALHVVTHIPRQAIRFSDRPGSTDHHLPTSFRHEIGLDDEVFPQAWRDLEQSAEIQ
eukprot:Nitzschia sp. Nitz4//scaffold137_size62074//23553//25160//NITZ4_006414-RA/size62074-processed-gene-0.85-mRNA-1//-1//CDS//3329535697//9213//frame0